MIALYLGAIVAANLLAARFGPAVTVLNAFLFIGLDLTSRDALHDRWHGKGLRWKMTLLVGTQQRRHSGIAPTRTRCPYRRGEGAVVGGRQ